MSDKRRLCSWMMGVLAVVVVTGVQEVRAFELLDWLDDPLSVGPPILQSYALLPGDDRVLVCPPAIDVNAPLTLAGAVDLALCRDPQIQSAWAAIKLQASAAGEAQSAYLPTLSAATSLLHNRTHYPDSTLPEAANRGQTAYASFNWRLFDFGGRAASRESANHMLAAALLSHDATLQKTLSAVVGAYFDVLTAQASVLARSETVRLARDTLATTERREARGAAAQSDTLQARAAVAKAELAEQRALGDQQKALSVLIYTMNLPPSTPIRLALMPELTVNEAIHDLERWLSDSSEHHPAILAARAQRDAARSKVEAVRAEGLPTVDFTANYYRNGYPNQGLQSTKSDTTTWGLTLTIPLFDGFARSYKIKGAQAQAEQSTAQLADVERQVLSDVVKAYADAVSSLANLQGSVKLLETAQAAVDSSAKRYAKGAVDILELLSVQAALADAQQERIRCLSEWRSARLRLMASVGLMGRLAAGLAQ